MKHLTGFLALFLFASLTLYAADLSDLTYTTTGGEVTITDCDEAATGGLVIPNTIEGNPVTSIGRFAFGGCTRLTSITIPDGVISIERSAFSGCSNLRSITIPDGVISIGGQSFFNCSSLTSITFGDGLTSIGISAFALCSSLESITIPDSVTSISRRAFANVDASIEIRPVTQNQLASQLAAVTAERDSAIADLRAQLAEASAQRDTAITDLVTVEAERDAILNDIQLAYDEVIATAGGPDAREMDLVEVVDPANAPSEVQSVGVIAQPREAFEVNTLDSPNNLDTELGLYDTGGNLVLSNDDAGPALQSQLNFSDGLAGGVYYLAVGTYNSTFNSDFAVSSTGLGGEYTLTLPTGQVSGTLEPSGFDWYRIEIGTNFTALQLQPLTELYRNLVEANASAISERDAAIEERDARFTEDQIRALSADYTIGLNDAGNVQMKFNLFESADLNTFAPLTPNPDSVSVVDGSICLEFAPEDRAAFFRFSVE